jgi:uncharacterized FlaG/YvyC family protein
MSKLSQKERRAIKSDSNKMDTKNKELLNLAIKNVYPDVDIITMDIDSPVQAQQLVKFSENGNNIIVVYNITNKKLADIIRQVPRGAMVQVRGNNALLLVRRGAMVLYPLGDADNSVLLTDSLKALV